jgi:hypothetical protein
MNRPDAGAADVDVDEGDPTPICVILQHCSGVPLGDKFAPRSNII